MGYLMCFLEGIITFISPCLLPMLPVYLLYFAGGSAGRKRTLENALGFVLGFTLVFVAMGAFAGSVGAVLSRYQHVINLVAGCVVILLGLHYAGVIRISFLNFTKRVSLEGNTKALANLRFFPSVLFGAVFSLGWTPCTGVFLSSALMKAASSAHSATGILLLLCYSLGLGIPFVVAALQMDRLTAVFGWVKGHYRVVNAVSGCLLVVVGVAIMTGWMGRLQSLWSFA